MIDEKRISFLPGHVPHLILCASQCFLYELSLHYQPTLAISCRPIQISCSGLYSDLLQILGTCFACYFHYIIINVYLGIKIITKTSEIKIFKKQFFPFFFFEGRRLLFINLKTNFLIEIDILAANSLIS